MNSGFLGLLQNENTKIYRRSRTWILAAILLVIPIAVAFIMQQVAPEPGENQWKQQIQGEIKQGQKQLKNLDEIPKSARSSVKSRVKSDVAEKQYYLEHDINPYERNSWSFVNTIAIGGAISVVTLFLVIIASDIVAGEFTWGSIKMLMVRPHSRWSILLSKYLASVIFAIALLLELFIASWLMGGIVFGFGSFDYANVSFNNGEIVKNTVSVSALQTYGLHFLTMMVLMTIAFMISTIFRSSGLAIGISIFILFSTSVLGPILTMYDWTKYLIFPNLDLVQYLTNSTGPIEGMTLPFSLLINGAYWAIFVIVTWWIFHKKDITT